MNDSISEKLNKGPIDVWSIRERLALASAVMRSGNQNWVSVSRSLKPFVDLGRSSDWFSQINCARQYQEMLEKAGTSRRKRGDKDFSETPGDVIVRRLITERIEELKATIEDLAEKYRHYKKELELVKSDQTVDRMKEIWQKLQLDRASSVESRKLSEEQAGEQSHKVLSPLKDDMPAGHMLEFSSVHDSLVDTEQMTMTDSMSLNDDQLSQSTTSSHITENIVAPGDIHHGNDVNSCIFEMEIKQEQVATSEPDTNVEDVASESQILETKEDESEMISKFEIKVEVKNEPNEAAPTSDAKEEEGHQSEHFEEEEEDEEVAEAKEKVDDEVTVETQEVEDDIVISTEEIVDEVEDGKNVPGSDDATAEGVESNDAEVGAKSVEHDADENVEEAAADKSDEKKVPGDVEPAVLDTPVDMNIEEPKTDESVDTEPSTIMETCDSKQTILNKNDDDCVEPTSVASSVEVVARIKSPRQLKQATPKSRKRESKRKSGHVKAPKTPVIKEEGKESEVSSKAGTSDDEEGKNLDEPIKSSTSLLRTKLDESLPNSPASVCNSDTEDERAHKVWKKAIMLVWRAISNHKFANIFMHPVTEDIAPGYHNVIFKPMDLNTIRKNIDLGSIRTTREFQRDMMLMFTNALMYNHSSHDVHKMARVMYQDAMAQIEQFVNTQVMMRSEPKLLRTSRRSDTGISDKEEEMRKRKVTESEPATPATAKKRRY